MEECLKLSLIILIVSSFKFDRAKPMEDEETKEPITTTTTPQGKLTLNVTFYLLNIYCFRLSSNCNYAFSI